MKISWFSVYLEFRISLFIVITRGQNPGRTTFSAYDSLGIFTKKSPRGPNCINFWEPTIFIGQNKGQLEVTPNAMSSDPCSAEYRTVI